MSRTKTHPRSGPLQFDAYFTQPGVLTGGLTVSVVAQLGAGATAANWKVDLFEFIEKEGWTNVGDLTGGELSYYCCLCCLHVNPSSLPSFISTPSARPGSFP